MYVWSNANKKLIFAVIIYVLLILFMYWATTYYWPISKMCQLDLTRPFVPFVHGQVCKVRSADIYCTQFSEKK